ncbi:MAG: biopolymer transporter ExbD [Wenzhouxiangellaceae bacterium]
MKRRHRPEDEAEINITPMLDIVFIMLIFFIVTTSFVKERGLDLSRPSQANNPPKTEDKGPIVVKISALSQITINDRMVDEGAIRANLEREKATKPESPLIIAADPDADVNSVVTVLDAAKVAGIERINVATMRNNG